MGFRTGDQLLAINNKPLTPETAPALIKSEVYERQEEDKLLVLVGRPNKKGKIKKKKLQGRLEKVVEEKQNVLAINPEATPQEKILQNVWLYGN